MWCLTTRAPVHRFSRHHTPISSPSATLPQSLERMQITIPPSLPASLRVTPSSDLNRCHALPRRHALSSPPHADAVCCPLGARGGCGVQVCVDAATARTRGHRFHARRRRRGRRASAGHRGQRAACHASAGQLRLRELLGVPVISLAVAYVAKRRIDRKSAHPFFSLPEVCNGIG